MGTKIKKMFPLRMTTVTIARDHVNLIYITAGETSHYVLVKDFSRLVSRQYNNKNDKKKISANIVCMAAPVKRY